MGSSGSSIESAFVFPDLAMMKNITDLPGTNCRQGSGGLTTPHNRFASFSTYGFFWLLDIEQKDKTIHIWPLFRAGYFNFFMFIKDI